MKTNFKSIILGAALLINSSGIALAAEATVKVSGNETFELNISEITENLTVSLTNRNGKILFEDAITGKDDYSKKFKVNQLETGTYFIKVEDSRSIKTLRVEMNDKQLSFDGSSTIERFKPIVMQKGSVLYVNYFTPEKSSLDISIYNSRGELVYSETLTGKLTQGKGFDFSKSPKDEYTIALASDGKFYSHTINLDK